MSMTIEQAKSELMQIYGALSPDKQRAIDTLVKIEPCEDVIDRAEAMTEIMMFAGNVKSDEEDIYIKVSDAVQLLRDLPSVNPQEPCEDAISRQAVLDIIDSDWKYESMEQYINDLPSVNPQEPKTGHWTHDGSHWKNRFICSKCGYKLFDEQTNFCPNCGAKMVEPQERSDKE